MTRAGSGARAHARQSGVVRRVSRPALEIDLSAGTRAAGSRCARVRGSKSGVVKIVSRPSLCPDHEIGPAAHQESEVPGLGGARGASVACTGHSHTHGPGEGSWRRWTPACPSRRPSLESDSPSRPTFHGLPPGERLPPPGPQAGDEEHRGTNASGGARACARPCAPSGRRAQSAMARAETETGD